MQLKLYQNNSENNQLNKDIVLVDTLTGTLRSESDVVSPTILIESVNMPTCNYAYIPVFNRYYYITELTSVRNGLWMLSLNVDPLMSFKQAIANLTVVLEETESVGADNYLYDDRVWIAKVKDKTDIIQFPSGLSANGDYILITAGG